MNSNNMWWGYLHSNGTVRIKRWFGDHEDYRGDCIGNPFVARVVEPFEADSQEKATRIIMERLKAADPQPTQEEDVT